MLRRALMGLSLAAVVVYLASPSQAEMTSSAKPDEVTGHAGALGGTWLWTLPDTANGLRPTQSWHATGSSPSGDIYVGGMDHKTNSALYRLDSTVGTLRVVGDARSASEKVSNWLPGETVQKFHTRPLWHNGKIYVATMNRSTLDEGYLKERGFHWYSYDPAQESFADLSVAEPGGTAVDHGNVVTLASDRRRNVIYAAGVPTGEIFRYDVGSGRTSRLGRPAAYDQQFVYSGRVMWTDSRGRLYFTASNSGSPSVYAHVYYFDPETGFGEHKDWPLQAAQALEAGQCIQDGKQCFFSDDQGHIYRFADEGPSWSYLGQLHTAAKAYVWLFNVDSEGRHAYLGTSIPSEGKPTALFEFDLRAGTTERICDVAELDPSLRSLNIHTGYDSWDAQGRFYFASFNGPTEQRVILTRVDIRRLKATLRKN
ncbi:sugar lactone lactonase YvrE [Bradyrhizobium sp. F1.13.3]